MKNVTLSERIDYVEQRKEEIKISSASGSDAKLIFERNFDTSHVHRLVDNQYKVSHSSLNSSSITPFPGDQQQPPPEPPLACAIACHAN